MPRFSPMPPPRRYGLPRHVAADARAALLITLPLLLRCCHADASALYC